MLRFIGSARFPKEYIPKCRSPSRCLKGGNNVHTSQTPFELRHTIRIRARLQTCRYSRKKDTGFSPCVWQFHSAVPIPRISYAVSCLKKNKHEDDVFCVPSIAFPNVVNPRAHLSRK